MSKKLRLSEYNRIYRNNNDSKINIMKRRRQKDTQKHNNDTFQEELSDVSFSSNSVNSDREEDNKGKMISGKFSVDELSNPTIKVLEDEEKKEKSFGSGEFDDSIETSDVSLIENLTGSDLNLKRKYIIDEDDEDIDSINNLNKRYQRSMDIINKNLTVLNSQEDIEEIKSEYEKKYNLPQVLSLEKIRSICEPFLPIALDLLNGKISSGYYTKAKQIYKKSTSSILSSKDLRQMDLTTFFAGYYGLMRQYVVGDMIAKQYKKELKDNKSPVLKWWGVEDFSVYILAPEVLISLCISEMKLKPKKGEDDLDIREYVYNIFEDTKKFGLKVADEQIY